MKEYTAKEMKLLKANPYTFKVTKSKLYFTIEFKEAFWTAYQAGMAPRKILEDLGYNLEMFGQKQIDSIVQSIKRQAQSGDGFRQGENRTRRKKDELSIPEGTSVESQEALTNILNEVNDNINRELIDMCNLGYGVYERGMEKGKLENLLSLVQKKFAKGKSCYETSDELETDLFIIKQIYEVLENAAPDSTQDELLDILLEKNLLQNVVS